MKNLLKSLLIVAFIAVSFQSNAQIKFGVKAGLNVSTYNLKFKEESEFSKAIEDNKKMTPNFHVGLAAEMSLSDAMSIQSGLVFTTKGMKLDFSEGDYEYTMKETVMYLEIPINIAYNITEQLQVYAGPYVAVGVMGKTKETETDEDDYEMTLKPHFGVVKDEDYADLADDEGLFKAFDFGINAGLGYKVNDNILINAGYSLGLVNLELEEDGDENYGDDKISNSVISIGATYFF